MGEADGRKKRRRMRRTGRRCRALQWQRTVRPVG
jgi:hypothetical protein